MRFELDGEAVRIPYWLAPEKRIVLLTVFRKTKMREAAEIERAHQARKVCEDEHGTAEHTYERREDS
ncbi:DNA-binding protein [Streptomyces sp. FR-008]|nr:DNA-binding protein [Streptomyces sp. FR-008]